MAEIGEVTVNVSLVVTDETADRMCALLSDYLNEHWEKDLEVRMVRDADDMRREVVIVDRG